MMQGVFINFAIRCISSCMALAALLFAQITRQINFTFPAIFELLRRWPDKSLLTLSRVRQWAQNDFREFSPAVYSAEPPGGSGRLGSGR